MRESAEAKGPMNITGTGVPKVSDLDLDMYLLWKQATSMILLSVFELNHLPLSGGSDGKESTCNSGELGSSPGLGRSPGGRHDNPLQYSCLENPPVDRGAWRAAVHGVAQSLTGLDD